MSLRAYGVERTSRHNFVHHRTEEAGEAAVSGSGVSTSIDPPVQKLMDSLKDQNEMARAAAGWALARMGYKTDEVIEVLFEVWNGDYFSGPQQVAQLGLLEVGEAAKQKLLQNLKMGVKDRYPQWLLQRFRQEGSDG